MLLLETAEDAELLPFELDEFAAGSGDGAAAAVDAAVILLAVAMLSKLCTCRTLCYIDNAAIVVAG